MPYREGNLQVTRSVVRWVEKMAQMPDQLFCDLLPGSRPWPDFSNPAASINAFVEPNLTGADQATVFRKPASAEVPALDARTRDGGGCRRTDHRARGYS